LYDCQRLTAADKNSAAASGSVRPVAGTLEAQTAVR